MKRFSMGVYERSLKLLSSVALAIAMVNITQCCLGMWHQPPISNELKAKLKDMK